MDQSARVVQGGEVWVVPAPRRAFSLVQLLNALSVSFYRLEKVAFRWH